jgi:hypothetical protein
MLNPSTSLPMETLRQYEQFFRPDFLSWLPDNVHIYRAFERAAFREINRGRGHFSARTIVQVMRDYTPLSEVGDWSPFKINDHRSPDLARVFVILHPRAAPLVGVPARRLARLSGGPAARTGAPGISRGASRAAALPRTLSTQGLRT